MRWSSKLYRWILIILIVVSVGGYWGYRASSESSRKALFEGTLEVCRPEKPSYYQHTKYNLTDYLTSEKQAPNQSSDSTFATQSQQGDIPWVDGEDREDVEAAMRNYHDQDDSRESQHNTALNQLRSPSVYRDRQPAKSLQIVTPTDGALYPPNLCAPFVEWDDPRNTLWLVTIHTADGKDYSFTTDRKRWRIPATVWQSLCENPGNQSHVLQIRGIVQDEKGRRAGNVQASPEIRFQISSDPADDYIVYRLVDPPFSSLKTPNVFIRDIRKDEPDSFLSARRQYCLNCHTFSSKEGNQGKLAMQVRSLVTTMHKLPVYLAIYDMDQRCGYKVQLPFEIQMTTFMAWSPDGNQLAYSANQKIVAMKPIVFETQLAGMATSDIAIYDVEKNETWLVPGACDPNLLEIYPQWTPDGKTMVFSRSPVGLHPADIPFDLYSMPLDGNTPPVPQPIEGASGNGRSNYFPHFSPDRKWFSFCQSDGGDLIRSSSNIFLKSGDLQGPANRLECNDDYSADSWHSWSSNSRWLVFSSKRGGGIYAYLYLTHIDENGHASPAIPLPLVDRPFASFNIPEFVAHVPDVKETDLFNPMKAETEPRLAQLRKINQGNPDEQKEKGGEI